MSTAWKPPVGTVDVAVDFGDAPLVVPPGTYSHFIVRPLGTVASGTLVVVGSLAVTGYFE